MKTWTEFRFQSPYNWLLHWNVPDMIAYSADKYGLNEDGVIKGKNLPSCFSSLYISGPVGVGKSVLAASYMYASVAESAKNGRDYYSDSDDRRNPYFVSVPRLLSQLRERMNRKDKGENPTEVCERSQILVLDDLGVENITDWTLEVLYILIDYRSNSSRFKQTIYTSNLSLEELARKGDKRIVSRLQCCEGVSMKGKDLRWKK